MDATGYGESKKGVVGDIKKKWLVKSLQKGRYTDTNTYRVVSLLENKKRVTMVMGGSKKGVVVEIKKKWLIKSLRPANGKKQFSV